MGYSTIFVVTAVVVLASAGYISKEIGAKPKWIQCYNSSSNQFLKSETCSMRIILNKDECTINVDKYWTSSWVRLNERNEDFIWAWSEVIGLGSQDLAVQQWHIQCTSNACSTDSKKIKHIWTTRGLQANLPKSECYYKMVDMLVKQIEEKVSLHQCPSLCPGRVH